MAQDKPKAKGLISKIVAQQVSDVHNSINRLQTHCLDNDALPCVSDKTPLKSHIIKLLSSFSSAQLQKDPRFLGGHSTAAYGFFN